MVEGLEKVYSMQPTNETFTVIKRDNYEQIIAFGVHELWFAIMCYEFVWEGYQTAAFRAETKSEINVRC